MGATFEVQGLEELIRDLGLANEVVQREFGRSMDRATRRIAAEAVKRAPADTGRLRGSIRSTVERSADEIVGAVGPNVRYGAYMEFGTGRQGDPEVPHKAGHWPPGKGLELWARRHGVRGITLPGIGQLTPGATVAYYIGRRGGLKPRRYLRGAFDENKGWVEQEFEAAVGRVVAELGR